MIGRFGQGGPLFGVVAVEEGGVGGLGDGHESLTTGVSQGLVPGAAVAFGEFGRAGDGIAGDEDGTAFRQAQQEREMTWSVAGAGEEG